MLRGWNLGERYTQYWYKAGRPENNSEFEAGTGICFASRTEVQEDELQRYLELWDAPRALTKWGGGVVLHDVNGCFFKVFGHHTNRKV